MKHLIGHKVEDFKVQAYHQGDFKEVTLQDTKGHWSIFFFYPADFTFVCPTELGDLADHYEEFKKENCEIYSVSTDTHFTHKAWADHSETIGKIQFPMLGDPTWALSKDFGVLIKDAGQALRGTFIVNPEGEIVAYFKSLEGVTEEQLGEYMLGINRQTPEEIKEAYYEQ